VRSATRCARDEGGFTFLEVLVAMVLFGVLVTISVGPYNAYRTKQQHVGATRELVAFLRRAQVRAVSEETTYRVDIAADGRSAQTFRFNGATYTSAQILTTPTSRVTYSNPVFTSSSGSGTSVYFYARGSASRGSVDVVSTGSSKTYTNNVEGLTARVSYND
jgi:prepilin-type N-terminal cleavage/methylation domain-containing protein